MLLCSVTFIGHRSFQVSLFFLIINNQSRLLS
nr:MAG TPA: hypothetical protein [Caudoviricetes sp.]